MVFVVDYASDEEEEPIKKKKKLPPLSSRLTGQVPVDDPSKHQGRTRTKPHVDGSFAALVLVPLRLDTSLRSVLKEIVDDVQNRVPEMHPSNLLDLHVSLSHTLYLRSHQRDELFRTIKKSASQTTCFEISFTGFDILCNEEKTRTFLTMETGAGHNELLSLAESLQPILEPLRQDTYYSEPRFHVSICWTLLKIPSTDTKSNNWCKELTAFLESAYGDVIRKRMVFTVDEIQVKIGKKNSVYKLRSKD